MSCLNLKLRIHAKRSQEIHYNLWNYTNLCSSYVTSSRCSIFAQIVHRAKAACKLNWDTARISKMIQVQEKQLQSNLCGFFCITLGYIWMQAFSLFERVKLDILSFALTPFYYDLYIESLFLVVFILFKMRRETTGEKT